MPSAISPGRDTTRTITPEVVDRIFSLFDDDDNGCVCPACQVDGMGGQDFVSDASPANSEIDFREVVCCLSVLTRGSMEERLKLLFDIFDEDDSGFLEDKEIAALAGAVMKGAPEGQADTFRRKVRAEGDFSRLVVGKLPPVIPLSPESWNQSPTKVTQHTRRFSRIPQGRTNHGR